MLCQITASKFIPLLIDLYGMVFPNPGLFFFSPVTFAEVLFLLSRQLRSLSLFREAAVSEPKCFPMNRTNRYHKPKPS